LHRKDVVGTLFVLIGLLVAGAAWSAPFLPQDLALKVVEALVIAAASVVGGVLAWIGLQLITTPPPKPVEELEKELKDEIEQIKKEVLEKLKDSSRG
jgi:hypothetical protein